MVIDTNEPKLFCNKCGEPLDLFDIKEDFYIQKEQLGYGTIYDGDKLGLRLCCNCMEELIDACKISPITENIKE